MGELEVRKVPFALDKEQKVIWAGFALRSEAYVCPVCSKAVVVREGEQIIRHFAHQEATTCTQEAVIHQVAKLLIREAVAEWKAGNFPAPVIERACGDCGNVVEQALPDKVEAAAVDYQTSDGKTHDIAFLVDGKAVAFLEIVVVDMTADQTGWHQVSVFHERTALVGELPSIIVDGLTVIRRHTAWRPLVDRFKPFACAECQAILHEFEKRAAVLAHRTNIRLPTTFYRYAISHCWRCKEAILVFAWPGQQMFATERPAHQPMPATIQFRFSKTAGSRYWANTCPHCRAIQGDFYLRGEVNSPLGDVLCEEETPAGFRRDLLKIAHKAMRGWQQTNRLINLEEIALRTPFVWPEVGHGCLAGLWLSPSGKVLVIEKAPGKDLFFVSFAPTKQAEPIERTYYGNKPSLRMPAEWREEENELEVSLGRPGHEPWLQLALTEMEFTRNLPGLSPAIVMQNQPGHSAAPDVSWLDPLDTYRRAQEDEWQAVRLIQILQKLGSSIQ